MDTQRLALLAGIISTSIFALSHIPMLVRAFRTKDLRSYSVGNLVLSNLGNGFHWLYVANLPFGPIWFLHGYNSLSTGLMLVWYLKYEGLPLEWRSFSDHATTRLLLNLCCSPTS